MAKVIVERPRGGGGISFPRGRKRDRASLEDHPRRERMKQRWDRYRKWLNENLAPLRRYLQSNVGRPWDKVFSEICERIDFSSAVQLHIWQHVQDYVCRDVMRVGREYVNSKGQGIYQAFVVDPRSGLLRKNPKPVHRWLRSFAVRRTTPPKREVLHVSDRIKRRRINGLWYEIRFADFPPEHVSFYDVLLRSWCTNWHRERLRESYGRDVYATSKRQVSSKEIRRMLAEHPDLRSE